jgi:hypothetical protein
MRAACSGASLINELRNEIQTGFPEIKAAATELTCIAERAWLRQVSAWVVYGRVPASGAQDFFVQPEKSSSGIDESSTEASSVNFVRNSALLPAHIAPSTGSVMLFIGKSLHQVQAYKRAHSIGSSHASVMTDEPDPAKLATAHLAQISALPLPLIPTQFNRLIILLRTSLSKNVLQYLLPAHETSQLLTCLRKFFLLDRGEFANALIAESERRLRARQQQLGRLAGQNKNPVQALKGLILSNAELSQTLQAVWKDLAASSRRSIHHQDDVEDHDDELDYARQHYSLVSTPSSSARPPSRPSSSDSTVLPQLSSVAFDDLLLPTPTTLNFTTPPPYDLILSTHDVAIYSRIHSYLLAIRRGSRKLSGLWSMEGARREPRQKSHAMGLSRERASSIRSRRQARAVSMRKVWATCSAAVFLLSETSAHFEGEVRAGVGGKFRAWVDAGSQEDEIEAFAGGKYKRSSQHENQESNELGQRGWGVSHPHSAARTQAGSSIPQNNDLVSSQHEPTPSRHSKTSEPQDFVPHDPSSLSTKHRAHLYALAHALLLTDEPLTRALRDLLGAADHLVAWLTEVIEGWRRSDDDFEVDELDEEYDGMRRKEAERLLQLDRARKAVDSSLRAVILRLRAIDEDRGEGVRASSTFGTGEPDHSSGVTSAGVHRLLMKLDFGSIANFAAPGANPHGQHGEFLPIR